MILSKLPKSKRFSSSSSPATLLKRGFKPSLKNYNNFLLHLFKTKRFQFLTHFISQLNTNQIEGDHLTHSIFTKTLLKQRNYEKALDFINTHIPKTPTILQNQILDSLIQGFCVNAKDPERGFLVLQDFLKNNDGIFPSSFTFFALISSFSQLGQMDRAIEVLEVMTDEKFNYPFDNFVISAVISGYVKIGEFELALGFYENAAKSTDFEMNIATYTSLLSAYCRLERFKDVSNLINMIKQNGLAFDVVFYGNLVYEYFRAGSLIEALQKHNEMVERKIDLDTISYTILIDGFSKEGFVEKAVGFLHKMRKEGIESNLITYTAIMLGFCKKGKLDEAFSVFKIVKNLGMEMDEFVYATMIDGFCKYGRIEEALEIFDEFRRTSMESVACYNCIIDGLCKKDMIDMAIQVFIELIERNMAFDLGIFRVLLLSIMKTIGPHGILEFVSKIETFRTIGYEGFHMICDYALCFLCDRGFTESVSDLYAFVRRNGLILTTMTYDLILELLLNDRKTSFLEVFLSDFVKKTGLYDRRVSNLVLNHLCMKDVRLALKFLESRNARTRSLTFPVSVLEKLVKNGKADDAFKLLIGSRERLPFMDVVDYTILVDGLCKNGYIGKALEVCGLAVKRKVTLNIVTYNSIINGLCREGCFVEAFRLYDSLESIDVSPSEITYATLIDALCKEGYLVDAKNLFERMVLKGLKPNIRVYNSLINGYSKLGRLPEVLKLVDNLVEEGVKSDEFTVSSVINSFCRNGNMEGALEYYFDCGTNGSLPDLLGFFYLIRGLCSKGRMEESRSVLQDMLQTEKIVDLLKKVDTGSDTDPVDRFLGSLCNQGRIREAVMILDEIVRMHFPVGKKGKLRVVESEPLISSREDDVVYDDFDAYYGLLTSLCSKGELKKANKVAKLVVSFEAG